MRRFARFNAAVPPDPFHPQKTYGPAARRGWLGLAQCINDQSEVREVCEGTNKRNDLEYYLTRHRITGDLHGQAPILWCASAWLRPPAAAAAPASGK
jgi:hypothetical protein